MTELCMKLIKELMRIKNVSVRRPIWDYSFIQLVYGNIIRWRRFQLRRKDLKSKLYLNVGCARNIFQHFINLDYQWVPNPDLCWDITKGIPLEDSSLLGIFIEHCLEHISYSDAYNILFDLLGKLRPGGTLRVVVPDPELYLDLYQRGKLGERINFP